MKKILLVACFALVCATSAMALEKGNKALGINLLYGTEIESMGIGAKAQYVFHDHWRGEAAFNYFFERKHTHMWEINLTAHYLVNLGEKFRVYPLAGPTVVNATTDMGDLGYGEGMNASQTKFGLNLGGGLEYDVSENFTVGLEARYSIVSKIDQAVFGIGATYHF